MFSLYKFREKCPAHWRPCFSPIWTIFKLVRDINKTNVLSNFHDDWAKIVTSSVSTRKTAPPTGDHVFQRTRTTFELNQHIIKTNILTKLHEDWARNVTSTVLTSFNSIKISYGTNLLTKFHEDRTKNVASRVKTAPPTGAHVFQQIRTTFKLHEDRKRNVPFRNSLKIARPPGNHVFQLTGTIF
ncbi:hypothetical protein DPMN_173245 [Dreissena polymorpha]|uniref:Uncharacterized protein n=1 Tax=Dreissena polymorpha TaxID=45954 RepID=A0A9D4E2B6_DREPO|nr:hypothetical protein DPMN_173245 [Dreissena polymorpha]